MHGKDDDWSNTPYDDVFRTMTVKSGKYRVPFLNEMFHLELPPETVIRNGANELFLEEGGGEQRKRITDSLIWTGNRAFHLECESHTDGTILVRMFEYDMMAAQEFSSQNEWNLTVDLPESGVLFLRQGSAPPNEMQVTLRHNAAGSFTWPVRVLRLSDYSFEELQAKELVFLFPFFLFNLEKEFRRYENGCEDARRRTRKALEQVLEDLNSRTERQAMTSQDYLLVTEMVRKVADHLAKKYDRVRKELDDIMGGKILSYPGEKEYISGIQVGEKRGEKKGTKKGEERFAKLTTTLLAEGKVDEVQRAAKDEKFRSNLYMQLGIE